MPSAVVAVFAFLAFWVIVAIGLFYVASRGGLGIGGPKKETKPESRVIRGGISLVLVVTYIAFGIVVPLLVLTGNHSSASAQVGGVKLTADEKAGREIFGEHCGVCHTLAAAAAVGKVGPDLDQIKPSETLVLHTIENGCLPNPPTSAEQCLGQGVMDANVVEGKQAQQVAKFVAAVAGHA